MQAASPMARLRLETRPRALSIGRLSRRRWRPVRRWRSPRGGFLAYLGRAPCSRRVCQDLAEINRNALAETGRDTEDPGLTARARQFSPRKRGNDHQPVDAGGHVPPPECGVLPPTTALLAPVAWLAHAVGIRDLGGSPSGGERTDAREIGCEGAQAQGLAAAGPGRDDRPLRKLGLPGRTGHDSRQQPRDVTRVVRRPRRLAARSPGCRAASEPDAKIAS